MISKLCSCQGAGKCLEKRKQFPVAMAKGFHLFPYRTQKLSPSAPKVLGWTRPGRIGRRRIPLERHSHECLSFLCLIRWSYRRGKRSAWRFSGGKSFLSIQYRLAVRCEVTIHKNSPSFPDYFHGIDLFVSQLFCILIMTVQIFVLEVI